MLFGRHSSSKRNYFMQWKKVYRNSEERMPLGSWDGKMLWYSHIFAANFSFYFDISFSNHQIAKQLKWKSNIRLVEQRMLYSIVLKSYEVFSDKEGFGSLLYIWDLIHIATQMHPHPQSSLLWKGFSLHTSCSKQLLATSNIFTNLTCIVYYSEKCSFITSSLKLWGFCIFSILFYDQRISKKFSTTVFNGWTTSNTFMVLFQYKKWPSFINHSQKGKSFPIKLSFRETNKMPKRIPLHKRLNILKFVGWDLTDRDLCEDPSEMMACSSSQAHQPSNHHTF